MMDWRIGRLITFSVKTVVLGPFQTVILNPSRQRVGVQLTYNTGSSLITDSLAPELPRVDLYVGGNRFDSLDVVNSSKLYTLLTHGSIPTMNFDAERYNTGDELFVTEWFLPENVLAESIKSFESEYGKWQL